MIKQAKMSRRVTEYFIDPLNGEEIVETFDDPKKDEPEIVVNAIEPETLNDISSQEVKACGCQNKAKESRKTFDKFIEQKIKLLTKGHEGQGVSMLMGEPSIIGNAADGHKKIKGTLAYAGVSLNNRLYLPEELAKGDGMTVPLIINHASTAGAEQEIGMNRVPEDVVKALQNGEQYEVGQVTLQWDADMNTLYYEGHIQDEFWQDEVVDANMAVSLGMYYDSDSPQVCNTQCYTVIRGAEFHEVSLVYHPGFPIATIEAVEVRLKMMASEAIKKSHELSFEHFVDFEALENISFEADELPDDELTSHKKHNIAIKGGTNDLVCKTCNQKIEGEAHEALATEGGGTCESCGVGWHSCPNCDSGLHDYEWEDWEEQDGDSEKCPNCVSDSLENITFSGEKDMLISTKDYVTNETPQSGVVTASPQLHRTLNDQLPKQMQNTQLDSADGSRQGTGWTPQSAPAVSDTSDVSDTASITNTGINESKKKLVREVKEVAVMDQTVEDQKALEVIIHLEHLNDLLKNLPK